MANYYTELSTQFDLPDPEQREWAMGLARALKGSPYEDEDEYTELVDLFVCDSDDDWFDGGEIDEARRDRPEDCGIWIHADESCNTEHVAWFIQAIMRKFDIKEPFIFEFAYTCSRPILDSFGGGACMVTQEDVHWFMPHEYAEKAKKEYMVRVNARVNATG